MGQPTAWPSGAGRATPSDPGGVSQPDQSAARSTLDGTASAGQNGWDDHPVPGQRVTFGDAAPGNGGGTGTKSAKPRRIRRRGTILGLRSGQLVAAELAAIALLVAAGGPGRLVVAAPLAAVILFIAFGRVRRHWAYEWLGLGSRYLGRQRSLPGGADSAGLLALLRPAAMLSSVDVDGAAVGVIEDGYGLTAVIELGDPNGLLADIGPLAPSPAELLPPVGGDQPQVRLQLLVCGMPAPALRAGSGSPATSYRQLTEGRILAMQRSFLAIHVRRSGGFADAELHRALSSALRRARRRLERDQLPCRALGADTAARALAELAHLDPANPLREDWSAIHSGGLRQVSFRLRRWPDIDGDLGRGLLPRLLTLPGAGITVSLAIERLDAEEVRIELVIRLASPDPQSQAAALGALRRLLGAAGAAAQRLDGTQLAGLAATLPLGGAADPGAAGLAAVLDSSAGTALVGDAGIRASVRTVAALELPVGGAGLMLGVDRHGDPTTVRLFRPDPTRVALFGGLRYAQLVALRTLALGGDVVIQTGRPQLWEPFVRGVSSPGEALTLVAPNHSTDFPAPGPFHPQLVVVDVGQVGPAGVPVVEVPWRATMVVRDDLAPHDIDLLARADLVVLPQLSSAEAEIAGNALGLRQLASHLPRVPPEMVGVVVGRRTLRWTLLSPTPIERHLIGAIGR